MLQDSIRLSKAVSSHLKPVFIHIQEALDLCLLQAEEEPFLNLELMRIREYCKEGQSILDQLAYFAGFQVFLPSEVDLVAWLIKKQDQLSGLLEPLASLKIVAKETLGKLHTDILVFEQALGHLLKNSKEAGATQVILEISKQELTKENAITDLVEGKYLCISIMDNGAGISQEMLSQVYSPFTTTKENHTGLGLSYVYGVMRQNNGAVFLDSHVDKGTVVKLFFPENGSIHNSCYVTPAIDIATTETIHLSEKSIPVLIVDDEDLLRRTTKRILESKGFHVYTVSSGEEALKLVKDQKLSIKLAMVDMVLPDMNGINLANQLRREIPSAKILFVSGYPVDGSINTAFIQKPFDFQELVFKVEEILKS